MPPGGLQWQHVTTVPAASWLCLRFRAQPPSWPGLTPPPPPPPPAGQGDPGPCWAVLCSAALECSSAVRFVSCDVSPRFCRLGSLLLLCVHVLLMGPPSRRGVESHPQLSTGSSVAPDSPLGGEACGSFLVISLLALSSEGENSGLYHGLWRGSGGVACATRGPCPGRLRLPKPASPWGSR